MALGSIIISLLANTGSFVTDTARAEKQLKSLQKSAREFGEDLGKTLRRGAVAGSAAVVGLAVAIDQALKSAAQFKDLEESTGGSAEGFASMAVAAAAAGVEIDSIGSAVNKLTKSLVGVDDESKAAGAALKAIGIEVDQFKKLDPIAQYEAVGKALNGYADGAEKVAVAQALFGKSGAEQLKVFKAIEEQGGRQVVLTQAQIESADAYADAQAIAIAQLKQYASIAAVQFLPAISDVVTVVVDFARALVGVDEAGNKLAAENHLKDFADACADAFAKVIDIGVAVGKTFDVVGKTIGASFAIVSAAKRGASAEAAEISKQLEEDVKRITTYTSMTERLQKQRAGRQAAEAAAAANPAGYSNEGRTAGYAGTGAKPGIDYAGADTGLDKALKNMERLAEARRKALSDSADDVAKFWGQAVDDINKAQEDIEQGFRDAGDQITKSVQYPAEALTETLAKLDVLLQKGAITNETYGRAAVKAQNDFEDSLKTTNDEVGKQGEYLLQAQRNIQDYLGSTLEDAFEGNFKNILSNAGTFLRKLLAQIAAAQINEAIMGKNGSNLASVIGAIGGLFKYGGSSTDPTAGNYENQMDRGVKLASGTNYVPRDGFQATLHRGEAVVPAKYNPNAGALGAGGGAGSKVIVENHGQDVQSRSDPNGVIRLIVRQAVNETAAGIASGTGPAGLAMKQRGINTSAALPRRA